MMNRRRFLSSVHHSSLQRSGVTMDRRQTTLVGLYVLALLPFPAQAQTVPPLLSAEWKFDVIHRTGGREPIPCLVLDQSAMTLRFKRVYHTTGKPTVVYEDHVPLSDVARVERLSPKEREQLVTRLKALQRERS